MKGGAALAVAGAGAVALVVAAGAVASQRQRALELSPLPSVENGGPRGLAAARAWLSATGRPWRVLRPGAAGPAPGEILLLVAPAAPLSEPEARELLAHAERGGLVVWAMGRRPQPALERQLGVAAGAGGEELADRAVTASLPHPIFEGIVLRTGGAYVRTSHPAALPLAGGLDAPGAASIPVGAGEAIVLASPDPLENFRLAEADNLALLSRLASLGPIAFDERHLATVGGPGPGSRRTLAILVAQLSLAGAVLLLALGRRLGAVREAVEAGPALGARDYLASLAALYRRAGAERELADEAWHRLRRALERYAVPLRASDEEAERLLAIRSARAAAAFRRALAARDAPAGEAAFTRLVLAAAELQRDLSPALRAR